MAVSERKSKEVFKERKRYNEREKPIFGILSGVSSLLVLCAALCTLEHEWEQIVGGALSQRSRPVSYENGILRIVVDGQAALQDMNFKKMSIARELSERSIMNVSEIKVEMGALPRFSKAVRGNVHSRARARTGTPQNADDGAVSAAADGIMKEYPDMMPELATAIARCRSISDNLK